jgi:hypothetical protein
MALSLDCQAKTLSLEGSADAGGCGPGVSRGGSYLLWDESSASVLSSCGEGALRARMMANRAAPASPPGLASSVARLAKEAVAAQVVSLFSERSQVHKTRARQPTRVRSEERLFPLGAVVRRVHGDVTTMMVGGISGLLLQMLHPAVLAGVWDHRDGLPCSRVSRNTT